MPRSGPIVDSPPVIGPAGTVHCSIASWSRFIADHLRGARGERALLKAETYQALHTPASARSPPSGGASRHDQSAAAQRSPTTATTA